ncbi:MAG TPA: DUF1192 domain-containing protein [Telmatospirillum sp.]|nr:DUF1192 domain-containing protein [Telmatospirillum sp.]
MGMFVSRFSDWFQSDTLGAEEARGVVMDLDDLEPRKKAVEQRNLEPMSVEELILYIDELQAEILRVKSTIAAKKSVRNGAESLFRK